MDKSQHELNYLTNGESKIFRKHEIGHIWSRNSSARGDDYTYLHRPSL